jgi:hypothetical protein
MWPAILKQYLPRHLYEIGLFMFLLILIVLFKYNKINLAKYQYITKLLLAVFLLFNIIMLIKNMKATETFAYKLNLAHNQLCANSEIRGKILCFIELPCSQIKGGVAQAVWMRGVNKNLPILELEFPLKILKEEYDGIIPTHKRFLEFAYQGNKIHGRTQKPDIIAFDGPEDTGNSVNAAITIGSKYTGDSLFFIGWDYKNFQFVKINRN